MVSLSALIWVKYWEIFRNQWFSSYIAKSNHFSICSDLIHNLEQEEFSLKYWQWWVGIAFICSHFGAFISILMPLWQSRNEILLALGVSNGITYADEVSCTEENIELTSNLSNQDWTAMALLFRPRKQHQGQLAWVLPALPDRQQAGIIDENHCMGIHWPEGRRIRLNCSQEIQVGKIHLVAKLVSISCEGPYC